MMTNDYFQDQLRFALAASSQSYLVEEIVDGKAKQKIIPWEVPPQLYSLDRQNGSVKPAKLYDIEKLILAVPHLAKAAKQGACLPLGALSQQHNCEHCGYRVLCLTQEGDLTSLLYASMRKDAEKFEGIVERRGMSN
jgi:hypothetical protein